MYTLIKKTGWIRPFIFQISLGDPNFLHLYQALTTHVLCFHCINCTRHSLNIIALNNKLDKAKIPEILNLSLFIRPILYVMQQ
jgi:hypothetical protein